MQVAWEDDISSWGVRDGIFQGWLVPWLPSVQRSAGLKEELTVHVARKKGHQKAAKSIPLGFSLGESAIIAARV